MKPASITPPGRLAALALAAMLAGCSFIPPYQQPAAPVASQWPAPSGADPTDATRAAADLPWQDFVQDPALRELVELALQNNRDLRVAVLAIEKARAQYGVEQSNRFPAVGATAAGNRTRTADDLNTSGRSPTSSQYSAQLGFSSPWALYFIPAAILSAFACGVLLLRARKPARQHAG